MKAIMWRLIKVYQGIDALCNHTTPHAHTQTCTRAHLYVLVELRQKTHTHIQMFKKTIVSQVLELFVMQWTRQPGLDWKRPKTSSPQTSTLSRCSAKSTSPTVGREGCPLQSTVEHSVRPVLL